MEDVNFIEYYDRIIQELRKNNKRNELYFSNLDLLMQSIFLNNEFTELEKVVRLRNIVYNNGSLSKKTLKNIDKELGYEKFYEKNCR